MCTAPDLLKTLGVVVDLSANEYFNSLAHIYNIKPYISSNPEPSNQDVIDEMNFFADLNLVSFGEDNDECWIEF